MNVQELRIGNRVKEGIVEHIGWRDGYYTVGCMKTFFESAATFYDSDDIHQIPLTEAILLKCGFKLIQERGYCSDEEKKTIYSCGLVDIAFSNNNFFLWVEVDEDPYYSFCWTKIEYLHQLQNIVFAISGTELEINL